MRGMSEIGLIRLACNEVYRGSKFALTRKGYEMLERYEGKLSRTVLRQGGASNRPILSLRFITAESAEAPRVLRLFQSLLRFSDTDLH